VTVLGGEKRLLGRGQDATGNGKREGKVMGQRVTVSGWRRDGLLHLEVAGADGPRVVCQPLGSGS